MVDKKKDVVVFEVEQVVTQQEPVIKRDGEDVSFVALMVEMANDLKEMKAALIGK